MDAFATVPEQAEAKRLLGAALRDGPAHAYLLHGPAGVGKRRAAIAFAGALLGDAGRVERRAHPDLYVLEPLGDQIRIDAIRELRRDLHMRPFEADRRVYLVLGAHLLNTEAADALLKDLEEPPSYATILLVADELGPLPETIRSRCQLVPFTRLSERAVREEVATRAPELPEEEATTLARVAAGRLDRLERLLDKGAAGRRARLLEHARGVYSDPGFDAARGGRRAARGREEARRGREGGRRGRARGRRAAEARGRAARAAGGLRRRARGDPGPARGARRLVPRPGRGRGRRRERGRPLRPARRAPRGRVARAARGGGRGRRRSSGRRGASSRS